VIGVEPLNDLDRNSDNQYGRQLVPVGEAIPALRDPYRRLSLYGGDTAEESDFGGVNFSEYWRILSRRKWLILGVTAVFVILAAVKMLMATPHYTSTVRLQIDPPSDVVEKGQLENFNDYTFMQTQYQLLESRVMAERVASALKLDKDAVGGISVNPVKDSRLIDLTYNDSSPERAQQVANAYADAFIALNIDKRFQANENAKVFLDDKIQQLKLRLENSERVMLDFAQKQQIVANDSKEKSSIAESTLARATQELSTLISERTKNEELWRQAESTDALNLPQLLSEGSIGDLRKQRSNLEIEYQEKLKTFKPSYPDMVQIRGKIDEIDRQLAAEAQSLKASLKAAYEASLARETELKSRVETLKRDLLDLQKRSIQYNILKREVDTNRELYSSLLQRYKEVDVAGGASTNNVFVVDRAQLGIPSSASLVAALLQALGFGLILGVAGAYGLERIDDKIHTPEQLEELTGLTPLGIIPKVTNVHDQINDPGSAIAEAYRSLCTALQFTTENGLPRSLVITSAGPSEGKSFTAVAIARHFATLGRRVLLIDSDLRNPSLHAKLSRENAVGLSNYLTGACTPPEVMQKTELANLAFIASGPLPPNAADLLGSARLVSLISIGSEIFDFIVIDGPPVLGLADALLLSNAASGTLFVVGANRARKRLIRGALRRLQLSRGVLVGAALSSYDVKAAGYPGYDYDYGYGYGYGAQANSKGLSVKHAKDAQPQLTSADAQPQLTSAHENV
jgi:succinoglycan biosynthesis transport protein ExoP